MSASLSPEVCLACDIGRVKKGKCQRCGQIYNHKPAGKPDRKSHFVLPTIREALPDSFAKERRKP